MDLDLLYKKQAQFASYLAKLIIFINSRPGYRCTIGEVERPQIVQDENVKSGKSKSKLSVHQYNIAGDVRIFRFSLTNNRWDYLERTEDYRFAGEYWESLDGECIWGGRFGDDPATLQIEGWDGNHFQFGTIKSLGL